MWQALAFSMLLSLCAFGSADEDPDKLPREISVEEAIPYMQPLVMGDVRQRLIGHFNRIALEITSLSFVSILEPYLAMDISNHLTSEFLVRMYVHEITPINQTAVLQKLTELLVMKNQNSVYKGYAPEIEKNKVNPEIIEVVVAGTTQEIMGIYNYLLHLNPPNKVIAVTKYSYTRPLFLYQLVDREGRRDHLRVSFDQRMWAKFGDKISCLSPLGAGAKPETATKSSQIPEPKLLKDVSWQNRRF